MNGMAGKDGKDGKDSSLLSVSVPISDFVREIAREAARTVMEEHAATCAIKDVVRRVGTLERKWIALTAFMLGSAGLGGLIGGFIGKLVPGGP